MDERYLVTNFFGNVGAIPARNNRKVPTWMQHITYVTGEKRNTETGGKVVGKVQTSLRWLAWHCESSKLLS